MNTYLECIPCLFRQALEAARISGADLDTQKKILDDVALQMPGFSLEASPPEISRAIHDTVRRYSGIADPYAQIKRKSNALGLSVYKRLKDKVEKSEDRLFSAVELAIAGNIIDYGVKNSLNVEEEVERILKEETPNIDRDETRFFAYESFLAVLNKSKNILYLADNAGETVFDRVLLEEIKDRGKEIIYAVKEKPIINDALAADAAECGLDKISQIISSGSDAPGTVLSRCSDSFLKIFKRADMVISKGQGNFEALSNPGRPVFCLFMAKCPVVAEDIGCKVGDILLMRKS